jgi:two-component system, sensor histidine kinase LadS
MRASHAPASKQPKVTHTIMRWLWPILLLLMPLPALAGNQATLFESAVEIGQTDRTLALSEHLLYRADPDRALTAPLIAATGHALEWTQSPDAIPNLGLGAPPHWFTVRLANTSPEDWSGLLEMSYTMIDVLDVYVAHGEDVIKVAEIGDQRPFSNRLLAHRNFLVPITVPAQESVRLIMLGESAGALKFPLDLWRMPAFFDHDQHALAPQILFAGIMLALVLYNFFLLLATRDWNYLWYVLSMVSVSFVVMSFHGILAQYAWPNIPALNNPVLVGAISVNIFSATIFAYSFLNLKRFASWVTLLFLGHSAAGALIFALNLFLPYAITIKLAALFSVTGATMGICTGVYLWYRGEILARFYTLAWFLLLAGSVTITFSHMGFLPSHLIFTHGQQIGAVAEGLLLSFALAYRINMERQQRFQAQAALLRVQTEANQQLEKKVQERTAELQAANEKLQEASATDGLTQVRNRYFFDEKLVHEWQKNTRGNNQMSLLMIDGDHFKSINDTHGHRCGDAVLKHLATILNASVQRTGDFVARYGGEEFTILLCHTDLRGAAIIAERICRTVESTPLIWEDKTIHFTVSVGVANQLPSRNSHPQILLQQADEALYKAKENGRNRVMLYTQNGIAAYP